MSIAIGHGRLGETKETHGLSATSEYKIWAQMIRRCTDERCADFDRYGGRGITVCIAWVTSFRSFLAHVGPRPSKKHTLDRKDNDRGYEPGNVRWATAGEQRRNSRQNHFLTFRGETLCITDWSARTGIKFTTLKERLRRGWPVERVLQVAVGTEGTQFKLTAADIEAARGARERGETYQVIADRYGVTNGAMHRAINGRPDRRKP